MMTMTMMMRTVERNASIYPKLEKLQEKGIPFKSIKKTRQAHFPRVCNPERETNYQGKESKKKNKHIKSNSRSRVFERLRLASPKPRLLPHTVDLRDHQCDNDDCNDDENYNPGLKRTMLGQIFPQYSERNT